MTDTCPNFPVNTLGSQSRVESEKQRRSDLLWTTEQSLPSPETNRHAKTHWNPSEGFFVEWRIQYIFLRMESKPEREISACSLLWRREELNGKGYVTTKTAAKHQLGAVNQSKLFNKWSSLLCLNGWASSGATWLSALSVFKSQKFFVIIINIILFWKLPTN